MQNRLSARFAVGKRDCGGGVRLGNVFQVILIGCTAVVSLDI